METQTQPIHGFRFYSRRKDTDEQDIHIGTYDYEAEIHHMVERSDRRPYRHVHALTAYEIARIWGLSCDCQQCRTKDEYTKWEDLTDGCLRKTNMSTELLTSNGSLDPGKFDKWLREQTQVMRARTLTLNQLLIDDFVFLVHNQESKECTHCPEGDMVIVTAALLHKFQRVDTQHTYTAWEREKEAILFTSQGIKDLAEKKTEREVPHTVTLFAGMLVRLSKTTKTLFQLCCNAVDSSHARAELMAKLPHSLAQQIEGEKSFSRYTCRICERIRRDNHSGFTDTRQGQTDTSTRH